MTDRILIFYACVALSAACNFAAPIDAQEIEATQNEAIVVVDAEYVEPQMVDHSSAQAQCVTVRKSVLGCMEGIEILPQDEVWMIDARDVLCGETDVGLLKVSRLVGNDLVCSELSELTASHASGDDRATVLYIHGNQTNEVYAIARGLQVYRNAFATKAHCHQPVRYIIWAWKSEQEKPRAYPDYLIKSQRAVMLGETFAATLNQFSDRNLIVVGFSLGVQVTLSAFDSRLLSSREGDPTRYQLALIAPAISADYVARHSLAFGGQTPVAQTFVFTNRKDRAIRAAQAIIRRRNPSEAATIAGLSDAGKLNLGHVTSIDVFPESGRFHSVERYTRSETLRSVMGDLINKAVASKPQEILIPQATLKPQATLVQPVGE